MVNAGFWRRLMAYNIDLMVLLPCFYLISSFITNDSILILTMTIVAYVYDVIGTLSNWKGTLGKRIMKLEVINKDDMTLSLSQSALRSVIKLLSIPVLFIAYLVVILRTDHLAIHDLMVRSRVIISNTR